MVKYSIEHREPVIIRNDDISANTDLSRLDEIHAVIKSVIPEIEIWACVNLFAKYCPEGAVYPDLPLKDKPQSYFYDVDRITYLRDMDVTIVSHGLWHLDHSQACQSLQEASIITSCRILGTNIFVPPFNRFSDVTERVCSDNNILLIKSDSEGWKSFEFNEFNPEHKKWYFHSWRWKPKQLKEYLLGLKVAA